jgi:hypothetical protein
MARAFRSRRPRCQHDRCIDGFSWQSVHLDFGNARREAGAFLGRTAAPAAEERDVRLNRVITLDSWRGPPRDACARQMMCHDMSQNVGTVEAGLRPRRSASGSLSRRASELVIWREGVRVPLVHWLSVLSTTAAAKRSAKFCAPASVRSALRTRLMLRKMTYASSRGSFEVRSLMQSCAWVP